MISFTGFVRLNYRWLSGGILLTIFASFGQTFFISLFSAQIRNELGLSHGDFGAIYMAGTLLSALTLVWIGKVVDHIPVAIVAAAVCLSLAFFSLGMALVSSPLMLFLVIFGLRLSGQGMMTHCAMTAMGRWYVAERGRAVSITAIGHQVGEGLLPMLVAVALLSISWRQSWVLVACLILFLATPLVYALMKTERVPRHTGPAAADAAPAIRRRELLTDPDFLLLCTGIMVPGFIGTAFFFHLVHIAEVNNWSREWVASSFLLLAATTTTVGLLAGILVDRLSARRLLPFFLVPLGLGCLLLSLRSSPSTLFLFMLLLGVSYGLSTTIFGAIWAEIYGTASLGAVRALAVAAMVLSSALGPGITGWLLDKSIAWSTQTLFMSGYCALAAIILSIVSRRLAKRLAT